MSGILKPWARHYQLTWEERSGNPRLPLWLRVASLAVGKHKTNGDATFRRGEMGLALSTVDSDSGEMHQPDRQAINRSIQTAVDYGFLEKGSKPTRLIVRASLCASLCAPRRTLPNL